MPQSIADCDCFECLQKKLRSEELASHLLRNALSLITSGKDCKHLISEIKIAMKNAPEITKLIESIMGK